MPKQNDVGKDGAFEPRVVYGTMDHRSAGEPHTARAGVDAASDGTSLLQADAIEDTTGHGLLPTAYPRMQHGARANGFALKEHVRYTVRQSERCFYCGTKSFKLPPSPSNVRAWLESEKQTVWNAVREHFRRAPDDFALVPVNWPAAISAKLRDDISACLNNSRVRADHLVPVVILKLLDGTVLKKELDFGGLELAVPGCATCGRERARAGMEAPQVLLDRWVSFYFDGNRIAARADPAWRMVETLVREGYKIASDLRRLQRGTLAL